MGKYPFTKFQSTFRTSNFWTKFIKKKKKNELEELEKTIFKIVISL